MEKEPRRGGLSKGCFCRIQCDAQETKSAQGHWTQRYIWHSKRHSEERSTFLKLKPSKKTFSWLLKVNCCFRFGHHEIKTGILFQAVGPTPKDTDPPILCCGLRTGVGVGQERERERATLSYDDCYCDVFCVD